MRREPGRPSFGRRFASTARIVFRRVGLVLGTAVAAAGAGLALIAPGAGAAVAGPLITAAGVASVVAAVAVIRTPRPARID